MEVANQIQLKFSGIDFPVVNFHSDRIFLNEDASSMRINVNPKVFFPKEDNNNFKIIQEVSISCKDCFELSLVAIGHFEILENIESDIKKSFVNINAPAIMFPYIRSFITTLTANLGDVTGTILIPTQFFKGDLEVVQD